MQDFWNLPIPLSPESPAIEVPSTDAHAAEMAALDRQLIELEWMRAGLGQFTSLETQLIGTVLKLAKLAVELESQLPLSAERVPILADLSKREHEVLELLLEGKSNKETAEILNISPRTVEVHRGRVMSKANAPNAVSLASKIFTSRLNHKHDELNQIIQSAGEFLRARLVESLVTGMDSQRAADVS